MTDVYLLLGTNEGNRSENLLKALALIELDCGRIVKRSSLYQTEAWGIKAQDSFLNQAVVIKTSLAPMSLLTQLKAIEKGIGRIDTIKWGPRVIDIDILFYENEIIDLPELKVPHPYISERRFTLEPLNEIAAGFIHPESHKTISRLLEECKDTSDVRKL